MDRRTARRVRGPDHRPNLCDPGVAEASVSCELIASPGSEIDVAGWSPIVGAPFQQYDMPMLGWARLPGGGTIKLECDMFSSDPLDLRLGYNESPLVATRVGAVLPSHPRPTTESRSGENRLLASDSRRSDAVGDS